MIRLCEQEWLVLELTTLRVFSVIDSYKVKVSCCCCCLLLHHDQLCYLFTGPSVLLPTLFVDGVLPTTADKIELYTQPPNSPDKNINDVGLFNALQSRYERLSPKNSIKLIKCVLKVWKEYPYQRINHLFLSLQMVFNETIDHHGGDDFKLPHMLRFKLEKMNKVPVSIKVHPNAWAYLLAMDDPDSPEGKEFVDDDLPLPGTILRVELAELLEDVSDEE